MVGWEHGEPHEMTVFHLTPTLVLLLFTHCPSNELLSAAQAPRPLPRDALHGSLNRLSVQHLFASTVTFMVSHDAGNKLDVVDGDDHVPAPILVDGCRGDPDRGPSNTAVEEESEADLELDVCGDVGIS